MIRDITIGQYYASDSVIHRLDPRVKIMVTLFYIISLFLFDDFMGYPTGRQAAANAYPQVKDMMKTDIRDVDGNYELEIDLPGFKKEDVKIQLKNGYLNIQATREEKKDEKDDKGKYVRRERYTGTCNRSFYVGSSIKHEDIHAKYENGILHVTFPKEETKKEAEEKKFVSID